MKYLVEIIPESLTDLQGATSRLAETLKLDPAKAAALLRRNPVTKPVSQAEAEKVARLFTKAGIEVFIRSEEEVRASAQVSSPEETTASSTASPTSLEKTRIDEVPTPPTTSPLPEATSSTPDLAVNLEQVGQSNVGSDADRPDLNTDHANAKLPSVVPEIDHASSVRSESETENVAKQNTLQINTMHGEEALKIPQGFFTPVPESEAEEAEPLEVPEATEASVLAPTPTRSGGLGKIAFASLVPGLLALAGVLTALYLIGLPLLRSQQRVSAETTAISLANSIGGWIGDVSLANPTLSQQVQSVITRTQADLRGRNIDFVLLSDAEGNQLAGWFKDLPTPGVPETITNTQEVSDQISSAVGSAVAAQAGTPIGDNASAPTLVVDGETLELASAAVRQGTTPVGAVVVGSSQQHLTAKLQQPLTMIVLAGALPLLLGIIFSLLIGRNRT
jgi:hypothetical protein